jgi:hypothetical protein
MNMLGKTLAVAATILSTIASPAAAEPSETLAALTSALGHFRGVGYDDVRSYRVEVVVPDPSEEPAPLEETWRAPNDLTLRAAGSSTATAIVRSLALYLEPLYVARSSLLDSDLAQFAQALEAEAEVIESARAAGGRVIHVRLPADPTTLPEFLRDLTEFRAELDSAGRLVILDVRLRENEDELGFQCSYRGAEHQPNLAQWSLPSGDVVRIETEFRDEAGRRLPSTRTVFFPSRFDPGETEEIFVRYGTYALNVEVTDAEVADARAFRYDENGLRTD